MNRKQVDLFFRELDRELARPCTVILTGAAAGALMGHVRPSLDIDFEIRPRGRKGRQEKERMAKAIEAVRQKFGTAVEYSEDIAHWSMIDLLDYRRKSTLYKRIGKLEVRLLSPGHWTIGKMARYLALDVRDMVSVLRRKKTRQGPLVSLWGRALRRSPLSARSGQFRRHVEDFLKAHGRRIWGRAFDPAAAVERFHRAARIRKVPG